MGLMGLAEGRIDGITKFSKLTEFFLGRVLDGINKIYSIGIRSSLDKLRKTGFK
jgi:hypothetical protein